MSDIDTEVVDNLKVLDPRRPIREATGLMRHSKASLSAIKRHMRCSKSARKWDGLFDHPIRAEHEAGRNFMPDSLCCS